jgi:hypothetical protein
MARMLPRPDPTRARKRARAGAAFAALLVACGSLVALYPRTALATTTVSQDADGSIGGTHPYLVFTIKAGVKLQVNAYDAAAKDSSGFVHIQANQIVLEAGASIDASGAGYAGVDMAAGNGPGGGKPGALNFPGGGGGFSGIGGEGTDATCTVDTTMLGGATYANPLKIDFGSAGGAAGVMSPGTGGGRGGGAIVLEAAEIDLAGSLLANGADGTASIGMIGSGAGAGGLIVLVTNKLVLGAGASIAAHGGNGGTATHSGGGGGGGLVVLDVTKQTGTVTPDVAAGHSGTCTMVLAGAGSTQPGLPPATCLDLDGDKHPAKLCGGDDCNDTDKDVNPASPEKCDGVDNDCSGVVDDNLPANACAPGLVCKAGGCTAATDAGTGTSSGDAPAKPDHLSLEGGCAIGAAPSAGALAMATIAAALLAGRRARRKRGKGSARPEGREAR